jgi:hypothetical protein
MRASKRRKGKLLDTAGTHVAQVTHPDEVMIYTPEICSAGGGDLSGPVVVDIAP